MVSQKATAVGCAIIRYQTGGTTPFTSNFVCDYSLGNLIGQPIYAKGPTASQCTTGPNPLYPGLCSPNENITPTA